MPTANTTVPVMHIVVLQTPAGIRTRFHPGVHAMSARLRALAQEGTAALAVLASAIILLLSAAAGPSSATAVPRGDAVLIAGSHRYYLQLAVTPAQQELGLGDRVKLPLDNGMLFVYHSSGTRCFWMKGMRFALDMIWLSPGDEVVLRPAKTFTQVLPVRLLRPISRRCRAKCRPSSDRAHCGCSGGEVGDAN